METARSRSNGHERITATNGYANLGRAIRIQRLKRRARARVRLVHLVDWTQSIGSGQA